MKVIHQRFGITALCLVATSEMWKRRITIRCGFLSLFPWAILWLAVGCLGLFPFHAAGASRTWDGGGTTGYWTNAPNWLADVAPANGDGLVFPAGVPRTVNTNSASAPSFFNSLTFTGSNYVLTVSSLTITNGITNSIASKTNTLNGDLTVGASSRFVTPTAAATLQLEGTLTQNFPLTIAGAGKTVINSSLSCSTNLYKMDSGTLLFNGIIPNSASTGSMIVSNGLLTVNGTASYISGVILESGGALSGTGLVTSVTAKSGSAFRPGGAPGQMTSMNGMTLEAGSTLEIDLVGAGPGGADQIICWGGLVAINGATLNVISSYIPSVGDSFTLIQGATLVLGSFAGLPEGAFFTIPSFETELFQITYHGGASLADVVIRDVTSINGTFRQWTNGSGSLDWTNAANWVGGAIPQPGDTLIFPEGISGSRQATVQGLASSFSVDKLLLGCKGLSLNAGSGNSSLLLSGGILDLHKDAGISIYSLHLPVTLSLPQTFSLAVNSSLIFSSPASLNLGGNTLTLSGRGYFTFNDLRGSGGLVVSDGASLILNGSNSFTGGIILTDGTMQNNAINASGVAFQVQASGRLFLSSGTVPGVNAQAGATVVFNPNAFAKVSCSGNFTFSTNAIYQTTLKSSAPLSVTGIVTLAGAALAFDSFSPGNDAQAFTNIINDGTDAMIGTFAGLPEGSITNVNGIPWRISYVGGSGNDLTFTPVKPTFANISLLANDRARIDGTGAPGLPIVLQTTTNLTLWTDLSTVIATNGVFTLTATNAPYFPRRFYRAHSQ